jgi:hypothetical protein
MSQSADLIIHIEWEGPYSQDDVASLCGKSDYGVYQVYGAHPVYGNDVLLYIGLADDQTFSQRLSQHGWCSITPDAKQVKFYVGRLFDYAQPDNLTWSRHIRLAERLLIHAHQPAANTQKSLSSLEKDLWHVHVLNWKHHRSLMPEVSGARWTERFDDLPYTTRFVVGKTDMGEQP